MYLFVLYKALCFVFIFLVSISIGDINELCRLPTRLGSGYLGVQFVCCLVPL